MATIGRVVPSKNQHTVKKFVLVRNTRWPSSTKNSSLSQRDNSNNKIILLFANVFFYKTSTNDGIKGFDYLIVLYKVWWELDTQYGCYGGRY